MTNDPKAVLSIRIEPELKARLEAAAKADRRSVSAYLAMLIERSLSPLPGAPRKKARKGRIPDCWPTR
jgi:hypothetical protein